MNQSGSCQLLDYSAQLQLNRGIEFRREMHSAILLSHSAFAACLLLLCILSESETIPCDTKWVRLMYMVSCGKKKRESVAARNESFSEPIPTDLDGAIKYFRDRDPTNPLFNDNSRPLKEILEDNESKFQMESVSFPRLDLARESARQSKKSVVKSNGKESVLVKKLINLSGHQNYLGIPGFPNQWDIHELTDQKINENHRREIDRLIEKCCRSSSESSCNGETFLGACR